MKRLAVFLLALMMVFMASGIASAELFTVSNVTYNTTYEKILDMYIRVLNANGDEGRRHDLFNDLIIFDFNAPEDTIDNRVKETKKRVGYCIYDLNGDGIDELIIGENYAYVHEVFTTDNGKVRELIRAGAKYNCALLENGYFYRYARNGGGYASSAVWTMNGTETVSFVEGYIKDTDFGSVYTKGEHSIIHEYQWFRMKNANDYKGRSETLVSVDEYQSWLKKQDRKLLHLSFIPLEAYEKGLSSENTGVISVKGKTNGRDKVRVRAAASKKSKVVKNLKSGTYVNILGEENGYYHISFSNLEGYVQKEFLTVLKGNADAGDYHIYDEQSERYLKKLEEEAVRNAANPQPAADLTLSPSPDPQATVEPAAETLLSLGSQGEDVRTLQGRLHDLGYYTDTIDGQFNEATQAAVLEFQAANELPQDGVVGNRMISVLYSVEAKPKTSMRTGTYVQVLDHYEDVPVQRSRQVYDHDEYTLEDNGNGELIQVAHPVYRTEYYTEIVQRAVYRTEYRENGSEDNN